ncbi:MAG: twin-arginine translocation signal domain-containing protein [Armatimonadota bacterium]
MSAISRREFIAGAAAAAGAAALGAALRADGVPSHRIAKVETFPFSYPTVGRFKFFEDAQGRPTGRQTLLVRITTEDGISGWGQSVPTPAGATRRWKRCRPQSSGIWGPCSSGVIRLTSKASMRR